MATPEDGSRNLLVLEYREPNGGEEGERIKTATMATSCSADGHNAPATVRLLRAIGLLRTKTPADFSQRIPEL